MSEQSKPESQDIQERRLANSLQLHRKIQSTLDRQEKERRIDRRYAIFGLILVIVIALIAIYFELTSEMTILAF